MASMLKRPPRTIVDKLADLYQKHRFVLRLYSVLGLSMILLTNPLHFSFVNDQSALIIIWLCTLYIFHLSYYDTFLLGLFFILISAISVLLHHPGYAQRFLEYTFWFFVIGSIQKIGLSLGTTTTVRDKLQKDKQVLRTSLANYLNVALRKAIASLRLLRLQNDKKTSSTALPLQPLKRIFSSNTSTKLSRSEKFMALLLVLPVLFIYLNWFLPFPLVSGDWVYRYPHNLSAVSLYAWTQENLGHTNLHLLWSSPMQLVEGVVFKITNQNFGVIEKIVWFLPILLSSIGSLTLFIRVFGGGLIANCFGVIFFLTNTYTVLLFSGGQMLFALGFSLFPAIFVLLHKTIQTNKLFYKLYLGLGVALLGLFDPRIAILFLLIALLYIIYQFVSGDLSNIKALLAKYISLTFLLFIIPVVLHLWWIVPTIIASSKYQTQALAPTFSSLNLSFMTLAHGFTVFSPHWPQNIFGKIHAVPVIFFIFPLLFYVSPFILKKPFAWFFLVVSLVAVFLTKGTNEPFGSAYVYLTKVLPGFQLFRDPSKFYVPLLLSYTLLFSLLIERLYFVVRRFVDKTALIRTLVTGGLLVGVALFLYGVSFDAFLKTMDGTLVGKHIPNTYTKYALYLPQQPYYRDLWLPAKTSFAYIDSHHPLINGLDLALDEPFNNFISNPYYPFTYLDDPAALEFLRMTGTAYIHIVSPRAQRFNSPNDLTGATIVTNQLIKDLTKADYQRVDLFPDAITFLVPNPLNHFFTADKVFWIYGTSKTYSTIKTLPQVSLIGNAFIRRETLSDIPLTPKDLWQAEIIESNFATESGVLVIANPRLARALHVFNTEINPKTKELRIRVLGQPLEKYTILARITYDQTQDKNIVYGRSIAYTWLPVTVTAGDGERDMYQLHLPNTTGPQAESIDRLLVYLPDQIPDLTLLFNQHQDPPIIEVEQQNPVSYHVSIREAKRPYMLVFAESYNSAWQASVNNSPIISFPVFNLFNGFIISTVGNYNATITFMPQRYIMPFVTVSLACLGFIVILLGKLHFFHKATKRSLKAR